MNVSPSKTLLLQALERFGIQVVAQEGKMIRLEKEYTIEIENAQLFKLLQDNHVIAPFADVEELCAFVQMDIQLNEED